MEKVNNGRIASWIALIGGVFCFACVALLGYTVIDPVSEFSPWAVPQLLFAFFTALVVPFIAAVSLGFGIAALQRNAGAPGGIRNRAWVGTILAGLMLLLITVFFLWGSWYVRGNTMRYP